MYFPRIKWHVQTIIFVALAMLAISTLYPPVAVQFGYLVAGALGGFLFTAFCDRRRSHAE